jgi:hypothetical protein
MSWNLRGMDCLNEWFSIASVDGTRLGNSHAKRPNVGSGRDFSCLLVRGAVCVRPGWLDFANSRLA